MSDYFFIMLNMLKKYPIIHILLVFKLRYADKHICTDCKHWKKISSIKSTPSIVKFTRCTEYTMHSGKLEIYEIYCEISQSSGNNIYFYLYNVHSSYLVGYQYRLLLYQYIESKIRRDCLDNSIAYMPSTLYIMHCTMEILCTYCIFYIVRCTLYIVQYKL